MGQLLG